MGFVPVSIINGAFNIFDTKFKLIVSKWIGDGKSIYASRKGVPGVGWVLSFTVNKDYGEIKCDVLRAGKNYTFVLDKLIGNMGVDCEMYVDNLSDTLGEMFCLRPTINRNQFNPYAGRDRALNNIRRSFSKNINIYSNYIKFSRDFINKYTDDHYAKYNATFLYYPALYYNFLGEEKEYFTIILSKKSDGNPHGGYLRSIRKRRGCCEVKQLNHFNKILNYNNLKLSDFEYAETLQLTDDYMHICIRKDENDNE